MTKLPQRIDTHQHFIPSFYREAMEDAGIRISSSRGLAPWSRDASLQMMDRNAIAAAVGSISSPGVYFGDRDKARELARRCNDYMAELVATTPDRFGAFATITTSDPEGACREIAYAIDDLKLDGVCLFASENGRFLGDPDFDQILAELDKRKAVVFVHPNAHPLTKSLNLQLPAFLLEYAFDTTRATTNLIFSRSLQRFSSIRFILPHAGGALPFLKSRLVAAAHIDPRLALTEQEIDESLRHFWYDVALSYGPQSLLALSAVADPDKIVFGSDWPYGPESLMKYADRDLRDEAPMAFADQSLIANGNAVRLFPRLGAGCESA